MSALKVIPLPRCPSIATVGGLRLQCAWPQGHRGNAADLFTFHMHRVQLDGVDILATWRDDRQVIDARSEVVAAVAVPVGQAA